MGLFKVSALICSLLVCVSAGGGGYGRGGYGGGYGGHDSGYGGGHNGGYVGGHGGGYGGYGDGGHKGYGGGGYGDHGYGGHNGGGYGGHSSGGYGGHNGGGYGYGGYGEHRPKPTMAAHPKAEPYINTFSAPKPHHYPAYGLTHAKRSCIDHYKPGAQNGYYRVFAMHPTTSIMVYCDFTSEPGMAYTMVMSSSENGRSSEAAPHEVQKSLLVDSPVNAGQPNNVSYRLSKADMQTILTASSVWRMFCTKVLRSGSTNVVLQNEKNLFNLYVRAKKDDYKLLETSGEDSCDTVEYARFGDTSCSHCTVPLTQGDATGYSVHIEGSAAPKTDCTLPEGAAGFFGGVETVLSADCNGEDVFSQLWFGRSY